MTTEPMRLYLRLREVFLIKITIEASTPEELKETMLSLSGYPKLDPETLGAYVPQTDPNIPTYGSSNLEEEATKKIEERVKVYGLDKEQALLDNKDWIKNDFIKQALEDLPLVESPATPATEKEKAPKEKELAFYTKDKLSTLAEGFAEANRIFIKNEPEEAPKEKEDKIPTIIEAAQPDFKPKVLSDEELLLKHLEPNKMLPKIEPHPPIIDEPYKDIEDKLLNNMSNLSNEEVKAHKETYAEFDTNEVEFPVFPEEALSESLPSLPPVPGKGTKTKPPEFSEEQFLANPFLVLKHIREAEGELSALQFIKHAGFTELSEVLGTKTNQKRAYGLLVERGFVSSPEGK